MEKELEEIITKLKEFISQYNQVRDSGNISLILELKDKILGWSFRFAELTADLKIDYNERYFIRKIATAKTKHALIRNGTTIGKAESESMIEHEVEYKSEQVIEGLSYKADILLRQTNMIIRAIEQRVSWLKVESKQYNNQ